MQIEQKTMTKNQLKTICTNSKKQQSIETTNDKIRSFCSIVKLNI